VLQSLLLLLKTQHRRGLLTSRPQTAVLQLHSPLLRREAIHDVQSLMMHVGTGTIQIIEISQNLGDLQIPLLRREAVEMVPMFQIPLLRREAVEVVPK